MEENKNVETEHLDEKTKKRLRSAWSSILSRDCKFFEKCKEYSLKEGSGFSVFKFLRPSDSARDHNCEYFYAEKGSSPYNMMINAFIGSKKEDLLKAYNPEKNFAICVCVPEYESGEETVQEIRLFNFVDMKEECF